MKIKGKIVDIHNREIFPAIIEIEGEYIKSVKRVGSAPNVFIMPGLIDSHIHIESSMLTPGSFAKAAVKHGTVGVVSDPHEIGNVLGIEGVKFMISDAEKVPLNFWFGAPSCVPATAFETSGAIIDEYEVEELLQMSEIKYLSEMMNFPGVIYGDSSVLKKIEIAKRLNLPIDGHAPRLSGENLKKYFSAGITTDHECSSLEEALEKIKMGMKIQIREGSAARNLDSLKKLIEIAPDNVMLCSDDLHPEMLINRHLDMIIAKLISEGFSVFDVLRACTINPVKHYSLEAGLLREGDLADFIIVDDPSKMKVMETWIRGKQVFKDNEVLFDYTPGSQINNFNCKRITVGELAVKNVGKNIRVIGIIEGDLITKSLTLSSGKEDFVNANIEEDILKIVIKDRYKNSSVQVGFIKGFGLKKGAIASSVAHDSHNIVAIGTNDSDIEKAVNIIIELKGGLALSEEGNMISLKLDIAGIMTTDPIEEVVDKYENLTNKVKSLGCPLAAPFMTLSFMALLVIPELKIGDKGLFDVNKFELVPLFI